MPKQGDFQRVEVNPGKEYNIPLELMKGVTMHHANLINFAVQGQEVSMTFCTKLDSMVDDEGTGMAIPHVVCFLSLEHAERALEGMLGQIKDLRELNAQAASQENAVVG